MDVSLIDLQFSICLVVAWVAAAEEVAAVSPSPPVVAAAPLAEWVACLEVVDEPEAASSSKAASPSKIRNHVPDFSHRLTYPFDSTSCLYMLDGAPFLSIWRWVLR